MKNIKSEKNFIPLSVLKRIFRGRAERRSGLSNKPVMRTSAEAISKYGELVVAHAEALADQIMDVTAHAGFNTVSMKHVEFYEEKFSGKFLN